MQSLKSQEGKDIWLMGGGDVFRHLLDLGEVGSVNVMVIPVLLGSGTPLMRGSYAQTTLTLATHRVYKSGIVSATYDLTSWALQERLHNGIRAITITAP